MSQLQRKQVLFYPDEVEFIERRVRALREAGELKVSFSEVVRRAVHREQQGGSSGDDEQQLAQLSAQIDLVVERNEAMLADMKARNDQLEQTLNDLEARR